MDIKGVISNPWVIGGGVLIGVVLLAVNSSGGSSNSGAVNSPSNALLNFQASQNALGLDYSYKNAELASTERGNMASLNLQTIMGFMAGLANLDAIDANHDVQIRAINADIMKTRIQTQAAAQTEANDNFTRLMTTYVGSDVSKYGIDAQVKMNDVNAQTQMAIQQNAATQAAGSANLATVLNFVPKLFGV